MRAKRKPKDEIGFTARTLLSPIERIEPLTYRIDDAAFALGVSTRKVWRLVQERKIPCRKIEGSAVIAVDDLRSYVRSLPIVNVGP